MKIQVLVFMGEIKFDLTLKKKSNFLGFFMLLFTIIKLRVNLVLFSVFRGYNIGWKRSFAPRKWYQIAFKAIKRIKSAQKKKSQSVRDRLSVTSAQKVTSVVRSQNVNVLAVISDKYIYCILKLLGKTFCRTFLPKIHNKTVFYKQWK